MYGKVFSQMYDSSVCDCWQALVTFQQFIVLADLQGVVDMTPQAISRRTGIPVQIIKRGIQELEKDDPRSRSPKAEGRRIERLDAHRDWGWQIVNYAYYRQLASLEDKREADRVRLASKRAAEKAEKQGLSQGVAGCSEQSEGVAKVAHIDIEEELEEEEEKTVCAFDRFWDAYPRKENKKKAQQAWNRRQLESDSKLSESIIADVIRRKAAHRQWLDGFVPHATTYLNGERWNDAIDQTPPRGAHGNPGKTGGQSAPERVRDANKHLEH